MGYRKIQACWAALAAGILICGPGATEAQAYVDPGTGGALFSSLPVLLGIFSAGIAVCFGRVKRSLQWLGERITGRRELTQASEPGENAS